MNKNLFSIFVIICAFLPISNVFGQKTASFLFNKGFNYLTVDKQEATKLFTESIKIDSSFSLAYYYRGLTYYKMGFYQNALTDFKRALLQDPNMIKCLMYQGFAYQHLNRPNDALHSFQKYLATTPTISKSDYLVLAKALEATGKGKEALVYFEKSMGDKPREEELYRLFLASFSQENYRKALEIINKIIAINPSFYGYYIHKGKVEQKLNHLEIALKNYDISASLNSQVPDIYFLKGQVLDTLGRFNEALREYTYAIKLNPTDGTYYSKRGNLKLTLGNKEGACLDWTIAGKLGYYADFNKIKTVCEQTTIYSK